MIIIAGQTADPEKLSADYASDSVERKIIGQMASSSEKYNYSSAEQLKFELQMRKEIIASSHELNRSRFGFAEFRKTRCNPEFWNRTDEGGFELKSDVKASGAIRDIFANSSKYATECATAMMIVYYKALLNIYGDDLFDKTFKHINLMNWHHIDRLLQDVGQMRKRTDYLSGDRRYFANPDVDPLTPEWQGENVVDLDGTLYYGHGIGITTGDRIISALNKHRIKEADEVAYLKDSAGRPNFKQLADIYNRADS
jgi:protein-glutamine gamma-glutamyltransferase